MSRRHSQLPWLFISTAFLGAGLLFLSEPMVGKLLLPLFGGSAAVWNTCLVFFQVMLLAGYAYAHFSVQRFGLTYQPRIQLGLVLLPLLLLPVALPDWSQTIGLSSPILRLLAILSVVIGAPFFVLATVGPLLQRWFAATNHPYAKQPYFLYVASNIGSFAALLAYPFLIEPAFSLGAQARIWAAGYGMFAVLMLGCVIQLERQRQPSQKTLPKHALKTAWSRRLLWLFLAFIPSSLMIGVTTYISTDVAAVPLLWIIPLALYLLTFVMAFGVKYPGRAADSIVPLTAAGLFASVLISIFNLPLPRVINALFYVGVFTLVGLLAHGRLAASRPEAKRLTEFYLWVSAGGALGGAFNSLLAPLLFHDVYELALTLLLAVTILVPSRRFAAIRRRQWLQALIPAALCLAVFGLVKLSAHGLTPAVAGDILILGLAGMFLLYQRPSLAYSIGLLPVMLAPIFITAQRPHILSERTFYGVIRVRQLDSLRVFSHGVTQHGLQYQNAQLARQPTTYFNQAGPLGDVMKSCRQANGCHSVGIIGLGVGTIAAYGQPGDRMTFYELDPAIAQIAQNPRYFTYLRDSRAATKVIIGDGRLSLQHRSDKYDLLVLDAFSSDAIPTHLLTREAITAYERHLKPHGLLAINISNRYLDLEPVLKAAADDQKLTALTRFDHGGPNFDLHAGSKWVVLGRQSKDVATLKHTDSWRPPHGREVRAWTDDYSNIFETLHVTR